MRLSRRALIRIRWKRITCLRRREGHPEPHHPFLAGDGGAARHRVGDGSLPPFPLALLLADRLAEHHLAVSEIETRRGTSALPFTDPHGLPLVLHETGDARDFSPWPESPVPVDKQVRGLHSVRLWERDLSLTSAFLTGVLGFVDIGEENEWFGFEIGGGGSGRYLEIREIPDAQRGRWGTGGVHHVAWRVADDKSELEMRERIDLARRRPTEVIDRFWFKSVYFLAGGVLFEIATDGPGFTVDEDPASLGEHLVLPPWLESHRGEIEAALPPIKPATESGARL